MHRWAHWYFPCFCFIMFDAVLHGPLDTLTFSVFLYTLFDALLHAQLDTLVFSLFYTYCLKQCYMLRLTHWRFPYFFTYCLIQCFVHSWTHCCFPCFIRIVLCSVTYTVGHTGVFPVLYILFYVVLHAPLDTLAFSVFSYIVF